MIPPDLHSALDTLGTILSLPILGVLIAGIRYIDSIKHGVSDVNNTLLSYTKRMDEFCEDHERRLREQEAKVGVLWDGHERRKNRSEDKSSTFGGYP